MTHKEAVEIVHQLVHSVSCEDFFRSKKYAIDQANQLVDKIVALLEQVPAK